MLFFVVVVVFFLAGHDLAGSLVPNVANSRASSSAETLPAFAGVR